MLRDFLKAERRLLIVAGMNEEAAGSLLDFENVAPIIDTVGPDFAKDPLEPERVLNALRVRREETCKFAKSLQDERKAQKLAWVQKALQEQQEERIQKFKRRMLNGIGGAALVTVDAAVGAGLFVVSAGIAPVVSAPLFTLSGAVGGALISEAVQQQL